MGKVKGGIPGHRNVMSLQPSKQHHLRYSGPPKIHTELWRHHSILQNAPCGGVQGLTGLICCGHHNKPLVPAVTAKLGHSSHSGSRACGHNIFPAG